MSKKDPHEPNETTEMWREVHRDQAAHRAKLRAERTEDLARLAAIGYKVRRLSEYQFRVNDAIDLYPTRQRFHVLKTGQRGRYRTLRDIRALLKEKK